jgi:hypothetical protein
MTRKQLLADARKTAQTYVADQVKGFGARVPKSDISKAVNKITDVLTEIRSAYSVQRKATAK